MDLNKIVKDFDSLSQRKKTEATQALMSVWKTYNKTWNIDSQTSREDIVYQLGTLHNFYKNTESFEYKTVSEALQYLLQVKFQ